MFFIFCKARPKPPFHSFSFWTARKKTESKERARKRPELRGRNTNSSNHSMNSLRSNSISYFVAQIANAIRDSILIQRICITLKTSSCGLFSFSCASSVRKHLALANTNTMLKHSGSGARQGADSPDERGWVGSEP